MAHGGAAAPAGPLSLAAPLEQVRTVQLLRFGFPALRPPEVDRSEDEDEGENEEEDEAAAAGYSEKFNMRPCLRAVRPTGRGVSAHGRESVRMFVRNELGVYLPRRISAPLLPARAAGD